MPFHCRQAQNPCCPSPVYVKRSSYTVYVGPQGPQGPRGPQGPQGPPGNTAPVIDSSVFAQDFNSLSVPPDSIVPIDEVIYNFGNSAISFNGTLNAFRATITGVYLFNWSIQVTSAAQQGTVTDILINLENSSGTTTYATSGKTVLSGGVPEIITGSAIVQLPAGGTATLRNRSREPITVTATNSITSPNFAATIYAMQIA